MTNSMNTMRFFMQHERVHVALSDSIAVVYLRAQSCALAETRLTKVTTQSALLAVDTGASVVRVNTQAQTESVTYNVYGLHSHGEIPPQRPAFNGHLLVSHLYLLGNGYRAYNSVLMRFQSPDSLSPFTVGGLNCYAYCTGDPINYADPSGHGRTSRSPSPTGRMSPATLDQIALETLATQADWSAADGMHGRLLAAREEQIVLEALNSQSGRTTLGSPVQNGQALNSAQGLQVAGASSAVSRSAQSAVPAVVWRQDSWAQRRKPMDAGDVAILRKFNDKATREILGLDVPKSREVRSIAINALAAGGNVHGALRKSSFSLTETQARSVHFSLKSALKIEKELMAIRQQ
ncbi:RHS repeat-associated core domain-containing protein [Pseudomonas putida]|uniref:RHS repeat-associated core domain-containing protein n=1 Tax=Pseudomonas putida TaxID=303 RepID=UPI001E4D58FB|nr:RHS repeat-associated core domain-containing protein [Pseudomonas putida]MCC9007928.1 RHS repeat-associated core domain-containing protein [Pseudomonas putida]